MALYMTQAAYTGDAWKARVESPQDRVSHIREMIEAVGGRLVSFYYSFGEYDLVLITEAPDNVSIASLLIAVAGGGSVSNMKTTVLMSAEDGQEAVNRAGNVAYRPPS